MNSVLVSRLLVPSLGLFVWAFYYVNGRLAYRPRSARKMATQLSLVFGSVCVCIAQVCLMGRLAPQDATLSYFSYFVFIEGGGALAVLSVALIRERARNNELGNQATS